MSKAPSEKRKRKDPNTNGWDCAACTFKNPAGAFHCEICTTPKGTSTRKTRVNTDVFHQQVQIQQTISNVQRKKQRVHNSCGQDMNGMLLKKSPFPVLDNVDRSHPLVFEVHANGFTVSITEFRPKMSGTSSLASTNLDISEPSPTSSSDSIVYARRSKINSYLSSSSEDFPEMTTLVLQQPQQNSSVSSHKVSNEPDESSNSSLEEPKTLPRPRGRPKKIPVPLPPPQPIIPQSSSSPKSPPNNNTTNSMTDSIGASALEID